MTTYARNYGETQLTTSLTTTGMTASVVDGSLLPASDFYVEVDGDSPTNREVWRVASRTDNTLTIASRYLEGSAAASGISHAPGVVVKNTVLKQYLDDVWTDVNGKVNLSTMQAKGDLLAGTGAGALLRLPRGTDNHVLASDSTYLRGLKWRNLDDTYMDKTKTYINKGDIAVGTGGGGVGRLTKGSIPDDWVLTARSTDSKAVAWRDPVGHLGLQETIKFDNDSLQGAVSSSRQTYGNIGTAAGPQVTFYVPKVSRALVSFGAYVWPAASGMMVFMAPRMYGASTYTADDATAAIFRTSAYATGGYGDATTVSRTVLFTLQPGTTTIQCLYRVSSNSAYWYYRRMDAIVF